MLQADDAASAVLRFTGQHRASNRYTSVKKTIGRRWRPPSRPPLCQPTCRLPIETRVRGLHLSINIVSSLLGVFIYLLLRYRAPLRVLVPLAGGCASAAAASSRGRSTPSPPSALRKMNDQTDDELNKTNGCGAMIHPIRVACELTENTNIIAMIAGGYKSKGAKEKQM